MHLTAIKTEVLADSFCFICKQYLRSELCTRIPAALFPLLMMGHQTTGILLKWLKKTGHRLAKQSFDLWVALWGLLSQQKRGLAGGRPCKQERVLGALWLKHDLTRPRCSLADLHLIADPLQQQHKVLSNWFPKCKSQVHRLHSGRLCLPFSVHVPLDPQSPTLSCGRNLLVLPAQSPSDAKWPFQNSAKLPVTCAWTEPWQRTQLCPRPTAAHLL